MKTLKKYALSLLMIVSTLQICAMEQAKWVELNKDIPTLQSIAGRAVACEFKRMIDAREQFEDGQFQEFVNYGQLHADLLKPFLSDEICSHIGEILIEKREIFNEAVKAQHSQVAALLLAAGVDVNLHDYFDDRLKNSERNVKRVKLLLDHGANVNLQTDRGWTLLHTAAYYGHVDLVQLLLDYGADVNSKNKKGRTPLHLAVYNMDLAEYDGKLSQHEDPIGVRTKIVQLLLEHGANVDSQDNDGKTPLHAAAYSFTNDNIIRMLLDHGAHIDVQDASGNIPYDSKLIQTIVFWRNLHKTASYVFEAIHVR